MTAADYDAWYYSHNLGPTYDPAEPHWRTFFDGIARRLVEVYRPATALDAGCAMGILVGSLRELGVAAEGIDLSDFAISQADARAEGHVRVADLSAPLTRKYDLITCIEVVEHIPAGQVEIAISNLCSGTDEIVFSSTPFDFNEATHLNVRQPSYWLGIFADFGFARRFDLDCSFISPWAVAVQRRPQTKRQAVAEYEDALWETQREIVGTRQAVVNRERQLEASGSAVADTALQLDAARLDLEETRAMWIKAQNRAVLAEHSLQEARGLLAVGSHLTQPAQRRSLLERVARRARRKLKAARKFLPR